nr:hypothetical protein CTI12_AA172110 [Tanacetum cinerariifolium]
DEEEEYPFVNKHLNFQEEPIVWVEEESCPVYYTDNEEKEDCDEEEVVNADYEEAPIFDDDQYEAATENISTQQDIQEELPTDEVQDNPIETPELQPSRYDERKFDAGDTKLNVTRDEEEEYPFVNKHLNFQEEPIVWVEEESCPVYYTDNEEKEDCDEEEVVNADYEEAPIFDDDQYEAATENISTQQDIQEELPTDEVQDNPIETPELQ